MSAQDRDQGDAEIGAGQQVVEEVGDGEGLPVEIALGLDPDQRGEQRLSSQPKDPGEEDARRDDRRCRPHTKRAAHGRTACARSRSTAESGTSRSP